jgi:hypothetical protein
MSPLSSTDSLGSYVAGVDIDLQLEQALVQEGTGPRRKRIASFVNSKMSVSGFAREVVIIDGDETVPQVRVEPIAKGLTHSQLGRRRRKPGEHSRDFKPTEPRKRGGREHPTDVAPSKQIRQVRQGGFPDCVKDKRMKTPRHQIRW